MAHIIVEFEKKLKEHGVPHKSNTDGTYIIYKNNDNDCIVYTQLILSDPVDEVKQGSRNNNKIHAIGSFKLRLPFNKSLLILAFQNRSKHGVEFIIIPSNELKRRLIESDRISTENQEREIVFWLMVNNDKDNCLYETTDIGIEWEWYYLSLGKNGRMIDKTDWDYSEYLNNWDGLKII